MLVGAPVRVHTCVLSGHGPALLSAASWLTGSCITISNTIMYTLHSGTLL